MSNKSEFTRKESISLQLAELDELINSICYFYQHSNSHNYVTTAWRSKDVLAHMVSWHESFAHILVALTVEHKPKVFSGKLNEINQNEVESRKYLNVDELISHFQDAQKVIKTLAFSTELGMIPYKEGSRSYEITEYLQVIERHFKKHFKQVRESYAAS